MQRNDELMTNQYIDDPLARLVKFSEQILAIDSTESLFSYIMDACCQIIGCQQASLMMFDMENRQLKLMQVQGFKAQTYAAPRIELAEQVGPWIYEGGDVFAISDGGKNRFLILFDDEEKKYFDCELRVPVLVSGKFICLLNIGKKSTGDEYSNGDITWLRLVVNMASLAVERLLMRQAIPIAKQVQLNDTLPLPTKTTVIKQRLHSDLIIGQSAAMQKVHDLIERVAPRDVTVLITGESGTGKELVARAIHKKSLRNSQSFVALNCAALPENLIESELFGHERGAFTGAHCQKKGRFEYADGGTLFLDEIGDMCPLTQAKLLRVLQEGTFQRLGGNATITVDVRIIAATNKNLAEAMQQGRFREDLYYRLNVVQIHIPPLRMHPEDIPLLAEYFFQKYNECYNKNIRRIASSTMDKLSCYDFPGNVRELQNIIERAVIMEQSDELRIDFLPLSSFVLARQPMNESPETLETLEKEYIKKVMQQVNFNKSQAARILGIARKTLREKMQRYGM